MQSQWSICAAAVLAVGSICAGQTLPPRAPAGAVTPAGSDFRLRGPAVEAAPGQILLLSVYGIKTEIAKPTLTAPGANGWPTTVEGISVDLVQGDPQEVLPVQIRALQQGWCAVPAACATITQLTLQLPFELRRGAAQFPYLRISENGTPVGAVMLAFVSDRIHVLNTCDGTMISMSGAAGIPAELCTHAVMVNARVNSLYNLIRGGDTVMMWAYGLGAVTQNAPPAGSTIPPNQLFPANTSFELNFDFRPNAPASPVVAGFGTAAQPLYVGYVGGGVYQINYAIPPVPPSLPACDGVKIKSNLTVTLTGPNSNDAAQLCVATQP